MLFQNYQEFGAAIGNLQVIDDLPVLTQQQCSKVFPDVVKDDMQFCAGEKGNH